MTARKFFAYAFLATAAQAAGWLPAPPVAAQNAAVTLSTVTRDARTRDPRNTVTIYSKTPLSERLLTAAHETVVGPKRG